MSRCEYLNLATVKKLSSSKGIYLKSAYLKLIQESEPILKALIISLV